MKFAPFFVFIFVASCGGKNVRTAFDTGYNMGLVEGEMSCIQHIKKIMDATVSSHPQPSLLGVTPQIGGKGSKDTKLNKQGDK